MNTERSMPYRLISFLTAFTILSLVYIPTVFSEATTLKWDANKELDLAGYRLYFKKDACCPPYDGSVDILLDDLADPSNPQISVGSSDLDVTPGTYYLVLTAFDLDELESDYSDEISATIPEGTGSTGGGGGGGCFMVIIK